MRLSFSLGKIFTKTTNKNGIIAGTADLYVSSSLIHGRGVFANRPFRKGSIIEACPILEIPLSYLHQNSELVLNYYAFMLDEEKDMSMILLGYGSIYNHGAPSSASTEFLPDKKVMVLTAVKNIARHEEITINYHGPYDCKDPIDFWREYK
jgi:SET domain-containing protein